MVLTYLIVFQVLISKKSLPVDAGHEFDAVDDVLRVDRKFEFPQLKGTRLRLH
jgi:hypothetical protein